MSSATEFATTPGNVTIVRMLLVLAGVMTSLNGLFEQRPGYAGSTHMFGWFLLTVGFGCWALALLLRRPHRVMVGVLYALLVILAALRIYQMARFRTAVPAGGLILPILIWWRFQQPEVRSWLSLGKTASTELPMDQQEAQCGK